MEASASSIVTPASWTTNVRPIAIDSIKIEDPDSGKRTFSEEAAASLAVSINVDGLLCPPIVEDLQTGQYRLLAGRHRVHACDKILGWREIPCLVLTDPDPDLVESIDLATNLLAHPFEELQRRRAIQRLYELHEKRTPATTKTGREPHGDGFAKTLEASLGVSRGHAQRLATTAKYIKSEDREILEKAGVQQTHIDAIAALREPEAIVAAVKSASTGTDPKEAIRKGRVVKMENKPAAAKLAQAGEKAAPSKASDVTDEEWLQTHCGKLLAALPFKTAFMRDAVLYRRISEKVVALRTGTKKALAEAKSPGANGAFFANVFRVVRASHPMNWFVCEGCNGHGHVAEDKTKQCSKCLGGGYKMKFEET